LVSRAGALALSWSLDHVGPLARSVEDAALLLSVLGDVQLSSAGDVSGVRVGVLRDAPFAPVEPDVEAALDEAVTVLAANGVAVQEITVPALERCLAAEFAIVAAEAASYHE